MTSCIHVPGKSALSGEHPFIYTLAAAPTDVDVFKTPFAATLVRNQRHTYFFHHMHLVLTRDMQLLGISRLR